MKAGESERERECGEEEKRTWRAKEEIMCGERGENEIEERERKRKLREGKEFFLSQRKSERRDNVWRGREEMRESEKVMRHSESSERVRQKHGKREKESGKR